MRAGGAGGWFILTLAGEGGGYPRRPGGGTGAARMSAGRRVGEQFLFFGAEVPTK